VKRLDPRHRQRGVRANADATRLSRMACRSPRACRWPGCSGG
jgi:hypothetical protein